MSNFCCDSHFLNFHYCSIIKMSHVRKGLIKEWESGKACKM